MKKHIESNKLIIKYTPLIKANAYLK
jgi:hypothetical protein